MVFSAQRHSPVKFPRMRIALVESLGKREREKTVLLEGTYHIFFSSPGATVLLEIVGTLKFLPNAINGAELPWLGHCSAIRSSNVRAKLPRDQSHTARVYPANCHCYIYHTYIQGPAE